MSDYFTPRVVIDLNSTDEDGETVALLSDVSDGRLEVGRIAIAYEPEEGVSTLARVSSIRNDLGIAFLQVNWRAMKREVPTSHTFPVTLHPVHVSVSASASAITAQRGHVAIRLNAEPA